MVCEVAAGMTIHSNWVKGETPNREKGDSMKPIDRRSFIGGAAAAGVVAATAAAGAGLTGCAGKPAASAPEQGATPDLPADLRMEDFQYSVVELDPITEFAEEATYDIVVVGAGCSGVPAVLTAVEEGASVACLQKEPAVSANGNGASFVLKDKSTPAGILRWRSQWAKLNDWRLDNTLFQFYVDHSEETVTWVVKRGREEGIEPIEYKTDSSIRYDNDIAAVCDVTQASNNELMTALAARAEREGATFYYSTPCVQLVQAEDGTVTGAIGKREDGTYVKLNANKGVILAAGDYMNNTSMVDRNIREVNLFPLCLVNHTGDGHILGILAGGRMTPLGHARQIHTNYIGPLMFYQFLAIGPDGKRFCNETVPMSSLNIPMGYTFNPEDRGLHWRVFDSKMDGSYKSSIPVPPCVFVGQGSAWMDPESCVQADTLEELCEKAGMPLAAIDEIKRYNEFCANGSDEDFGVDPDYLVAIDTPPYFAIIGDVGCSAINAGIQVDGNYQVIDNDRNPIPHLYAAGVQAGQPCGGINWNMPGGFSNSSMFTSGRYTVIHALTGGSSPKNPSSFADLADVYVETDEAPFGWNDPMCATEIAVW